MPDRDATEGSSKRGSIGYYQDKQILNVHPQLDWTGAVRGMSMKGFVKKLLLGYS